jgi:HK97 gp10 family phage protein
MPDVISIKIEGLDELERKLDTIPLKVARRVIRESLKDAAEIWAEDMRAHVRRGPHDFSKPTERIFAVIANAIRVRLSVKSDLEGEADVGPGKNEYWSRFLEFGTRLRHRGKGIGYSLSPRGTRLRNRGGASTGTMPAFPFIKPAFDARKEEVLARFIQSVRESLAAEGFPVD